MRLFREPRHRSLWHLILAPTIWAVHFCVVYAITAISCEKGIGAATLYWSVVGVTVVALAGIAAKAVVAWKQWDYTDDYDYDHGGHDDENRREFLGHVGFLLAGISAIGVIYVVMPVLLIGSCL